MASTTIVEKKLYDEDQLIEEYGYDDHFHEHHHGDKFQSNFINTYIFSMDHKIIAKQFLITGMFWALIGSAMSIIFRLQLGYPEESLAWLKPLLGKWITVNDAGIGTLAPEFYYALVTMHGTILVFFVLTAGLSGTFSNLLIPLQVGARDMASPFLNMLSYWFFFLAGIIMFFSLFLNTGPFAGGWTAYPPLSALPQASSGSGAGMTMWVMSLVFFVVSVLLGGINYITTVLNLRTKGMSMWRLPLTIWAFFVTAIIGLLSFPVLVSAFLLVMFDRGLGTSFFLSEIFIGGQALDHVGGSPVLYQHLFWFLGHPEVYIIILPAMGIVSEVLSVHSRKPVFGYKAMVFSILAIAFLSFIVWAHHMFMSGVNPFISNFFVVFTLIIAVPSAVKVFNWIATLYGGNVRFNSASLFGIGFVSMFISGGLTGIFLGNSAIDIQMHDTYFVVAHFHIVMGVAAFFGMFAGIYHWFPKMYGRFMNETLGKIHFWGTLIGAYAIFWPMHYIGMAGVPRRYYRFDNFEAFSHFDAMNQFITIAAILTFAVQLLFVVNFFLSIWRGRQMKVKNPWGATTLEWSTPIKAGHGNWDGKIPAVHRWAYDYSKDEDTDFTPQYVPVTEEEKERDKAKYHH
jgi:cytochrome c oxidase subunit 1